MNSKRFRRDDARFERISKNLNEFGRVSKGSGEISKDFERAEARFRRISNNFNEFKRISKG